MYEKMMPDTLLKLKLNLTNPNRFEIEDIRQVALRLVEQNWALTQSRQEADNYRVEGFGQYGWFVLETGTKDFCIGYYTKSDEDEDDNYPFQVVCGDLVVWPEKWYGTSAADTPDKKELP